jgi:hypothetical protein
MPKDKNQCLEYLGNITLEAIAKRYNNCRKLSVPEAKRSEEKKKVMSESFDKKGLI